MSDYCVQKLTVSGPAEDLAAFITERSTSLATVLRATNFELQDAQVVYKFKTKTYPPAETEGTSPTSAILKHESGSFPSLTFLVMFVYEGYYEGGQVRYQNREFMIADYFASWFRTAKPGEPIHHRTGIFDPKSHLVSELIANRVLFRPDKTALCENTYAFRVPLEDLLVSPAGVLEYTLDEDDYLEQCVMNAGNYALWGSDKSRMGLRICDCPITLIQDEIDWLITLRLDDSTQDKVRRIARFIYSDFFDSHPTNRRELLLLLDMPKLNSERRLEIIEAMKKPIWTEKWPAWDELTDVCCSETGDPTFLAELENL
jgi:hypothetical protein